MHGDRESTDNECGVSGLNDSIYWSEQTSMRTRLLLMLDWIKRGIFGRDLSKVS
jgi:hypothetical protein